MPSAQPFVIKPDPQAIKQHPTLSRQVRELSESYEDATSTVDDKRLQLLGGLLWEVLNLGKQLDLAKNQAGDNVLTIIIESDDGLVISLPWETLHHPEYGFLARESGFTLTRRMPKGKKSLPKPECAPLRVLLFTSLPDDLSEYARLQIEDEQAAVLQTLAAAEQEGRIQLEMPDDGRFDSFKATLQNFKPHVVYFSGHGKFDYEHHNAKAWAVFQFEDEWGKTLEVGESEIRDCLIGSGVQAVVLSACESAKSHKDYADNGLAQCLHVAGIPHVIGMRESVYDLAGIEFAKAFFAALSQEQSMDQALQQARLAIQAMPKQRSADEHWCLPAQFSQDLSQPLVDWAFEPKPRGQVQSTRDSVNGISLPPKFIGRRRELREWQNALRSGEKSECLIIGAGGMGKTALAGKLLDSLKRDGYEVFGLSVRPDEEYDWRRSLSELEQLLKDEFLIKQYQMALGEATTIEMPDDLGEPPKVTVDEHKRAEALLNGLLRQYDGQFTLMIDNLESVQDEQNLQVNDLVLLAWIEVARGFADRGLKLILTSRWQLPEWRKWSLCLLGQPVFADYVAFIRELNLPVRFMGNAKRVRAAFDQLGGNYRALTFFAAAAQGMTLGAEQEFLEKLGQAKEEIQIDLAIEKVYEQLNESQREVLSLMRVYLYSVDMEGIRRVALPEYERVEEIVESLVAVSLVESSYTDTDKLVYFLPSLIRDVVIIKKNIIREKILKQKAASYFLENFMKSNRFSLSSQLKVFNMLSTANMKEDSIKFFLKFITNTMSDKGSHKVIIEDWLLPFLKFSNEALEPALLNELGRQFIHLGQYEDGLKPIKKAINYYRIKNNKAGLGIALNNSSHAYEGRGELDFAIKNLREALTLQEGSNEKKALAITLNNLALLLNKEGSFEQAVRLMDRSLKIRISIKGCSEVGQALLNLSSFFYQYGQPIKAIDYLNKAIDFQKEMESSADFKLSVFNNFGAIYRSIGESEKAIEYFKKSLKLAKEVESKSGSAIAHNNIAGLLRSKGIYAESLENYKISINIAKQLGNKEIQGSALSGIGEIYFNEGNYEDALYYYEMALFLQKDISDYEGIGYTLINLGRVSFRVNANLEKSLPYLEESLEIFERLNIPSGKGQSLSVIGNVYFLSSQYDQALVFYERSRKIHLDANMTNSLANDLVGISKILYLQGLPEKSISHLEEAISIQKKNQDKPGLSGSTNQLGKILMNSGFLEAAEKKFKESLSICEEIGDRSGESQALAYLGVTFNKNRKYSISLKYSLAALDINKLLNETQNSLPIINNIATVYMEQGELGKALQYLKEALEINVTLSDKYAEMSVHNNISQIYFRQGNFIKSMDHLKKSNFINNSIGDIEVQCFIDFNIGFCFINTGNIENGMSYLSKSYANAKKIKMSVILQELEMAAAAFGLSENYWEEMERMEKMFNFNGYDLTEQPTDSNVIPFKKR